MQGFIDNNIQYFFYGLLYIVFCFIAERLINYLKDLEELCEDGHQDLGNRFDNNYRSNAKKQWEGFKKKIEGFGDKRSYYSYMLSFSILLVIVNSFILSAFLDSIGNLQSPILIEPIRINYSHLIAAAIVIIEIATGMLYYIGHTNQLNDEDNSIYAMLKYFSIIAFISLMAVETIMWARLSVKFDMPEALELVSNNVFRDYVDYFLGALGIGFTLAEFGMGYFMTEYNKYGKGSTITNYFRYSLTSLLFILIYYIPSILILLVSYSAKIFKQIIKLIIIPGESFIERFKTV